jgi:hypothetical protein
MIQRPRSGSAQVFYWSTIRHIQVQAQGVHSTTKRTSPRSNCVKETMRSSKPQRCSKRCRHCSLTVIEYVIIYNPIVADESVQETLAAA